MCVRVCVCVRVRFPAALDHITSTCCKRNRGVRDLPSILLVSLLLRGLQLHADLPLRPRPRRALLRVSQTRLFLIFVFIVVTVVVLGRSVVGVQGGVPQGLPVRLRRLWFRFVPARLRLLLLRDQGFLSHVYCTSHNASL